MNAQFALTQARLKNKIQALSRENDEQKKNIADLQLDVASQKRRIEQLEQQLATVMAERDDAQKKLLATHPCSFQKVRDSKRPRKATSRVIDSSLHS